MADMRQLTATAASSGAGAGGAGGAGSGAGGKKRTGPGGSGGSGNGGGDRELLSVRELSHATEEIKAFFDVPQLAAVMPLCRRCVRARASALTVLPNVLFSSVPLKKLLTHLSPTHARLVNRVRMYDEVFPQLDMLVSQLYRALCVQSIDSIVPAVQALIAHGQLQLGGAAAISTSNAPPGPLSTGNAQMAIHQGQYQQQNQQQQDSQSEPVPMPAPTSAANAAPIALSSSTSHFEVSSFARAVDADEALTLRSLAQPSHQQ